MLELLRNAPKALAAAKTPPLVARSPGPPPVASHEAPTPPDAAALTAPPCLIMLGGLGDMLIALCIAKHYSERFGGARTPFLTSLRFQNILSACSYVERVGYHGAGSEEVWKGYREAIAWARTRYPVVYPLHVGDADVQAHLRTTRFCHEQYLYAGVPGRYGDFPLVFDRRSPEREAALVAKVRGVDPRPLFLLTLKGRSSPFTHAEALRSYLVARWPQLRFVDTSALDLPRYQDLLGLLDASVGALSIDTSTIHLMPASSTPYIALLNDTKTPWWQSVPRGECWLQLGYTRVMLEIDKLNDYVASMLYAKGITPNPVVFEPPQVAVIADRSKPHLVTLACDGMEKVWRVAERTWKPWCAARGVALTLHTKAPDARRHPSWNKLLLVLAALEKHDVVWWIDSDITVARPDSALPDSQADLAFATDWNGLCAGMFRARATAWTKDFLRAALALGDVRDSDAFGANCGDKWEQNTFKALLRDFPAVSQHVELLPRTLVCDRPARADANRAASFYHFGNLSNAKRVQAMRRVHSL